MSVKKPQSKEFTSAHDVRCHAYIHGVLKHNASNRLNMHFVKNNFILPSEMAGKQPNENNVM
jgi:hypothetical protein